MWLVRALCTRTHAGSTRLTSTASKFCLLLTILLQRSTSSDCTVAVILLAEGQITLQGENERAVRRVGRHVRARVACLARKKRALD